MRELDPRHLHHVQFARREDAAMPGDDPVVAVDQDRVGEPELADAAGDLRDLRLGMRPRVPGIIVQHGRERRIGALAACDC
jgi:hypothetical protein